MNSLLNIRYKLVLYTLLLGAFIGFQMTAPAYAAKQQPPTPCNFSSIQDNFLALPTWYQYLNGVQEQGGSCHPTLTSLADIWLIVLAVIDILLRVAAIVTVFMIIYGGTMFTTSMGSPDTSAKARKVIIDALIGLLIAVMASFLVTFVAGSIN